MLQVSTYLLRALLALSIASSATAAIVTATVTTIGIDTMSRGPIGDPGTTFGRACTKTSIGIIPIVFTTEDPSPGACTGTFKVITPAIDADASTGFGTAAVARVLAAGAGLKTIEAGVGIIGISPFAGAEAKDPIQYGALQSDTVVQILIQLTMLEFQTDPLQIGSLHLDYSIGNSPTNQSTLFDLDITGSFGNDPTAAFHDISAFLTGQSASWNESTLSNNLTNALKGGATVNFNLPNFQFDLPAASVMYVSNDLGVNLSTVPEPSTILLMGIGMAGLAVARLFRKQKTTR